MKTLYEAKATVEGAREGHGRTDDGKLDVDLATPGGQGEGTNPEQLFAVGYGACFQSALSVVARRAKADPTSTIAAEVDLMQGDDGGFNIGVVLDIEMPNVEPEQARELVAQAHEVCPYSKATRGNIPVELKVSGQAL